MLSLQKKYKYIFYYEINTRVICNVYVFKWINNQQNYREE